MPRRARRLPVLLLLALSLLAAACADEDPAREATGPEGTAADTQELRVGAGQDEYVLEGPRANLGMYPLNTNVVETLTYLSPKYEVTPLLAERWEFREPNTWRFFLRRGVTFHDGQPFNAQAVKAGLFDRVAAGGGGTIKAGPESAVVVDDHTIDFTPTAPNRRVPEQIVHPQNGVIAPGSVIGQKPVGTGPFRFVEYRPKERVVVERNPDYWGTKAKAARVVFRFFPEPEVRRQVLEAGEIHIAAAIPRQSVPALETRFTIAKSPVGAYRAMYANVHGAPPHDILSDERVRRAVAIGIDRKKLVDNVLDGLATTDQTMIPPNALDQHADKIEGFEFDPDRAKRLLDEAGWVPGPDGVRAKGGRPLKLTLTYGFGGAEIYKPTPTFLQSELKNLGIAIDIAERPDSASYQAVIKTGQADLFLEQGTQNDGNPGFLPVLLFYTGGAGASADYQKLFAPGAEFDRLIAPSLTEVDPDKVKEAVAEAMHHIIDQQAIVIPLAGIFNIHALDKSVKGFQAHPSFLNTRWAGVSVENGRG